LQQVARSSLEVLCARLLAPQTILGVQKRYPPDPERHSAIAEGCRQVIPAVIVGDLQLDLKRARFSPPVPHLPVQVLNENGLS